MPIQVETQHQRLVAAPDLVFLADGTAKLYVRRSHTDGKSVMEKTKTDVSLSIGLPPGLRKFCAGTSTGHRGRRQRASSCSPPEAAKCWTTAR